jgi:hypothetical protein
MTAVPLLIVAMSPGWGVRAEVDPETSQSLPVYQSAVPPFHNQFAMPRVLRGRIAQFWEGWPRNGWSGRCGRSGRFWKLMEAAEVVVIQTNDVAISLQVLGCFQRAS